MFGVVALIDLLYQYWVHTQQIGKLGWFDRWFCSPSATTACTTRSTTRYLDRNYGGILIVWDRLFGSFSEEDDDEPCVYGTRSAAAQLEPAVGQRRGLLADCAHDSWHARALGRQAARVVQAAGLAAGRRGGALPKPAFEHRARGATSRR